jgi:hypothetical protein
MGHLFRWLMEQQAARFKDDAQLQADWEAVQAFGDHEKFADGFIEYMKEGKAPNSALRRAFQQFKQWLIDFYNAIRGNTGVKLSDEMRGVFDRIIAGDSTFGTDYGLEAFTDGLRKTAKVIPIDAQALPVDYKNTGKLINWVKSQLQGKQVSIKDDGQIVSFTGQGIRDNGKARGAEQRQAYTALEELIENAVFDHFEEGDTRHPTIEGQNVYFVGAKIGEGDNTRLFSVRIKVDMPKASGDPSYKAHKVTKIEPDPFQGQSANAETIRSAWGSISEITLNSRKINYHRVRIIGNSRLTILYGG